MTGVGTVVKSVGPKLLLFFNTLAVYFVVFIPESKPSLIAVVLKCLPIVSLMIFVALNGISWGEEHSYSRRILSGLIFSCIGDALLVYKDLFIYGVVAFGIAQLSYTSAFGFEPFNFSVLVALSTYSSIYFCIIFPNLYGAYTYMLPAYGCLLTGTVWRAVSRAQLLQRETWTWTKLSSCFGCISFMISDSLLGMNDFVVSFPYHQVLIMTFYYLAQLGIALSIVDGGGGKGRGAPKKRPQKAQ